jgi:ABC-type nitrate/sulfonate/bicarbonate transport system substrate-binding protein
MLHMMDNLSNTMQVTITGVPEHFNIHWKKLVSLQPFLIEGIELLWKDEPKGSGAMNQSLRTHDTDIAIILTESFVKDKIEGNPGLITSFYVQSPLIWGIHVSGKLPQRDLKDYQSPQMAISRFGSGSHLMSYILAKRENWNLKKLEFDLVNDLNGAIIAAEQGKEQLFLWEKFTTNPFVESGIFQRIGEIPTPWPCFVVVAHESFLSKHTTLMKRILDFIHESVRQMKKDKETILGLCQEYNLLPTDVDYWLQQTRWASSTVMSRKTLESVMDILTDLELIKEKIHVESLIAHELVMLES